MQFIGHLHNAQHKFTQIMCCHNHMHEDQLSMQNLPNIDVWCTICMTPYWSSHRTTKVRVEGEQTGRTIAEVNPGYSQDSLLICDIRGGVHHLFVLWVGWISDQTRTHATNASQLREGWLGEVFEPPEHDAQAPYVYPPISCCKSWVSSSSVEKT